MPENKNTDDNEKLNNERVLYLRRRRRLEYVWAVLLLSSLFLLLFYQGWLYWGQNQKLPWLNINLATENWYGQD